jgi:anaerobic selenocysteine-containing dehydrogenase
MIHPADAASLAIADGDAVTLGNTRGESPSACLKGANTCGYALIVAPAALGFQPQETLPC